MVTRDEMEVMKKLFNGDRQAFLDYTNYRCSRCHKEDPRKRVGIVVGNKFVCPSCMTSLEKILSRHAHEITVSLPDYRYWTSAVERRWSVGRCFGDWFYINTPWLSILIADPEGATEISSLTLFCGIKLNWGINWRFIERPMESFWLHEKKITFWRLSYRDIEYSRRGYA